MSVSETWEEILLNYSAGLIAWEKSTFKLIFSHQQVWSTLFSKVNASTKKLSVEAFSRAFSIWNENRKSN